jgi:hypothetical protein
MNTFWFNVYLTHGMSTEEVMCQMFTRLTWAQSNDCPTYNPYTVFMVAFDQLTGVMLKRKCDVYGILAWQDHYKSESVLPELTWILG